MSPRLSLLVRKPLTARIAAAATIAIALLLVLAALTDRAGVVFVAHENELAAGEDIRASVSFDRASYLQGERLLYRLLVAWRPDRVAPDFDALERNISFHPFDSLGRHIDIRRQRGGVRLFVAEFRLQAVDVDAAASYDLATASVFYTRRNDADSEVHAVRANPPRVHIGEYFPGNVAAIELLPTKPRIDAAENERRAALGIGGTLLLVLAVAMLWWRGRHRPYPTLSPAEQLWRDFATAKRSAGGGRERLVEYERFAARAFELRAGIAPLDFWMSGELGGWQDQVDEVRRLVSSAYRTAGPAGDDVAELGRRIEDLLQPVIEKERLQLELHDGVVERLRRQPRMLAAVAGLWAAALLAFVLSAWPALWLPADVVRFNAAAELLEQGGDLQPVVDAFVAAADGAGDVGVRSASLHNAGTLLVDPGLLRLSRDRQRNLMQAMFSPDLTMDRLLHDMDLDSEFELVNLLRELTRRYVQAEQLLQAAIRADPAGSDTGRNLELVAKTRRAIASSLARLAQLGDETPGGQQMLSQTVIDLRVLMEAELPDDLARFDEGKDDRAYFIMEKF